MKTKTIQMLLMLAVCCIIVPATMAQDDGVSLALQQQIVPEDSEQYQLLQEEIQINLQNVTVAEALEAISEKADLKLMYSEELLPAGKYVTLIVDNLTLNDVLWAVLDGTGLQFAISANRQLVLVIGEDAEGEKLPELFQETVRGTVVDAQTGEALPGVTILVEGTTDIGTVTDLDGNYELNIPSTDVSLAFSYIGYQRFVVDVDGRDVIDIQLREDIAILDDIVVIGYGTQRREDITTAVSTISSDMISTRSARNLSSSLQGMAPGVSVTDIGGEPGAASLNIRIRGVTTLGNTNPLFIVDGVEQSINDINPNDIESITILEDATSTAIYGSRAANGVVVIETKRGSTGQIQVNYEGRVDFQNLATVPEHLETEAHMRLQNLGFENQGSSPRFTEEDIQNTISGDNPLEYPLPNTWFDTVIQDNAPMTRNSLSISGGGDILRTYASVNHFDQQGIYPNRDAQNYQINVNNDIYLLDNLTLSADLRFSQNTRTSTNQFFYHFMIHGSQFAVPQFPDGTYGLSPQRHNPLMYADPDIGGLMEQRARNYSGNFSANLDIIEGLNFTSRLAINNQETNRSRNWPTYEIRDYFNPESILHRRQINSLDELRQESTQLTWYNTLNYIFNIDTHNFDVLAGFSQETYDFKSVFAGGRDVYNNDLRNLGLTESDGRNISSSRQDWGLQSYFSRINYNFDSKYYLQFNMRYDGSSRFAEGDRYTFFPSASIGWRVSNESFWQSYEDVVDNLMLRASWGETGNQNVGLYTYFDNLSLFQNNYTFNENPVLGIAQTQVTSEGLTWETTTQLNFGADISFWEGQLEASFDWYHKDTEGILLTLPISGVTGLSPAATNAGSVENRGWGLQLTHRNYIDDLFYSVSINLSDVKNKITDLAGTGPYFSGERNWMVRMVGHPIDALWGYETDGFLTQEDLDQGYPTFSADAQPGDIKYVDRNNDGVINADDRTVIGSTLPRYEFGANFDFGWKNFDLNFQLQGVGRRDVAIMGALSEGGTWEGFTIAKAGDYWTPDNPNARFPRPQKQTLKNQEPSDWWVEDGSYVRLKNFQLGYSLSPRLINQLGFQRMRLFVGGTNLITFSNLKEWGMDAEMPVGRGTYYPPVKTYTIGININI